MDLAPEIQERTVIYHLISKSVGPIPNFEPVASTYTGLFR